MCNSRLPKKRGFLVIELIEPFTFVLNGFLLSFKISPSGLDSLSLDFCSFAVLRRSLQSLFMLDVSASASDARHKKENIPPLVDTCSVDSSACCMRR